MSKLVRCGLSLLLINLWPWVGLAFLCAGCSTPSGQLHSKCITTPDGVQLKVSVPASCQAGKPVNMVVTLANKGGGTVSYGETGIHELGISVVDSRDVPAVMTEAGKSSLVPLFSLAGDNSKYITKKLKPGKSAEWRVDLDSFYHLPPNEYFVSVEIWLNPLAQEGSLPRLIWLPLNWVEFTIH